MRWLFAPISALFAAGSFIRWKLYRRGLLHSFKAPAPVISVGNIALGGTGKTPCVIWLARQLESRGFNPVILTRGYRRKAKGRMFINGDVPEAPLAGDEPALMARQLPPNTLIVVDPDRAGSAREVRGGRNRVFILDDGFQHLRLKRDFDIVLLPADNPLSNGHFAPWGGLRDGQWRLKEADAIILVGTEHNSKEISELGLKLPIFTARRQPVELYTLAGIRTNLDVVRGQRVIAFAGIAKPQNFQRTLSNIGAEVVAVVPFPDHYEYRAEDIRKIESCAEEVGADILITTEKDAVRLVGLQPRLQTYILAIEFAPDKPEELMELIMNKIRDL